MTHRSPHFSRRRLLQATGVGLLGSAPWFRALAEQAAEDPRPRPKSCILLWMNGGPSQLETLDPKPGHRNGGPTKSIATAIPGIQIAEHLPLLAQQMKHVALVRSMSTREGDHQRATFVAHTGRVPQGQIAYPTLGSFASKEMQGPDDLPHFVSIGGQQYFGNAWSPGFLGPEYAPLSVGAFAYAPQGGDQQQLQVANLQPAASGTRLQRRWELLESQQRAFTESHPDPGVRSHQATLRRARKMIEGRAQSVFDLSSEPQRIKDRYGEGVFGQGCLLARRLVEAGVPFVEVSLSGWDTHSDNFGQSKQLCQQLDAGWATLLDDLHQRGLLESTLVVWMGEFGRTPAINPGNGRDHFPQAWSAALAGAGLDGGRVVGRTSDEGMTVEERPVNAPQMLATICRRLDLDLSTQNMSNIGRPIRLVDPDVEPIEELL